MRKKCGKKKGAKRTNMYAKYLLRWDSGVEGARMSEKKNTRTNNRQPFAKKKISRQNENCGHEGWRGSRTIHVFFRRHNLRFDVFPAFFFFFLPPLASSKCQKNER